MSRFHTLLHKYLKPELLNLGILLLLIGLASFALFQPGFFRTHDDVSTIRIIDMARELQRGFWKENFPVRWSGDLSFQFGYPLFLFYAPLAYYVGAFLHLALGFNPIIATKWVYVFPLIIGPIVFYCTVRQKADRWGAIAATALYTLFPYRGFNTYIRGGVGETWAMAFLPGIFGGIFIIQRGYRIGGIIFSFFLTLLLLSHNLTGFQVVGLLVVYGLLFQRKSLRYWFHILLSLGLSAFYLLPSIWYVKDVKALTTAPNTGKIIESLIPLKELINIQVPLGKEQKFSGFIILIVIVGLIVFWRRRKALYLKSTALQDYWFWGGLSASIFFLLTIYSKIFWQVALPITAIFQFAWRVQTVLSFAAPLFLGLWITVLQDWRKKAAATIISLLICLTFVTGFKPLEYSFFYEYDLNGSGPCGTTTWEDEYLPKHVLECPKGIPSSPVSADKNATLTIVEDKRLYLHVTTTGETYHRINIRRYYFPWWQVKVDGEAVKVKHQLNEQAYFSVDLAPGSHDIIIQFKKTPAMWIADGISLISVVILIIYSVSLVSQKKSIQQVPAKKNKKSKKSVRA